MACGKTQGIDCFKSETGDAAHQIDLRSNTATISTYIMSVQLLSTIEPTSSTA